MRNSPHLASFQEVERPEPELSRREFVCPVPSHLSLSPMDTDDVHVITIGVYYISWGGKREVKKGRPFRIYTQPLVMFVQVTCSNALTTGIQWVLRNYSLQRQP